MSEIAYNNPMRENAHDVPSLTIGQCKQIEADSRMILTTPEIYELRRIVITGCGDSYAAGISMKPALEFLTGLPVDVEPAIHLSRYTDPATFGKPGSTQLLLNGKPAGQCTLTRFHRNPEGLINTFVLPLDVIGSSFKGKVYRLEVKHTAPAGPTVDPNLLPKKK